MTTGYSPYPDSILGRHMKYTVPAWVCLQWWATQVAPHSTHALTWHSKANE